MSDVIGRCRPALVALVIGFALSCAGWGLALGDSPDPAPRRERAALAGAIRPRDAFAIYFASAPAARETEDRL